MIFLTEKQVQTVSLTWGICHDPVRAAPVAGKKDLL